MQIPGFPHMPQCMQARIQGFGQVGPAEFWPQGGLSPKFAKNRDFSLKIAGKLHDFEEILGASAAGMCEGMKRP